MFGLYTGYILAAYGLTFGYLLSLALHSIWQVRRLRRQVHKLQRLDSP